MSPPPHSPRWRPGHHPGAGGRGTGLGPHHHHKGLHHPTHSQRRPGTWKGQRGREGDVMSVAHGRCVPEPAKLQKSGADTLLGDQTKRKEDRKGGNNRAHRVRARKTRGHSSQGVFSPAPSLPWPCLLRGKICFTFASPENLSITAPSSGQPSQFSQPPSCITYSCEPICELSLCFVSAPMLQAEMRVCLLPQGRLSLGSSAASAHEGASELINSRTASPRSLTLSAPQLPLLACWKQLGKWFFLGVGTLQRAWGTAVCRVRNRESPTSTPPPGAPPHTLRVE